MRGGDTDSVQSFVTFSIYVNGSPLALILNYNWGFREGGVPFQSPPEGEVELQLPNRGSMRGLGIRRGVTLIVGGGFHGKSTLLEALQVLDGVNICNLDLIHISPGGCVQPCARGWQRICGD